MKMAKQLLLISTALALVALIVPAFAAAEEFKQGGVPVSSGEMEASGSLTFSLGGITTTCNVDAHITITSSTNGEMDSVKGSECTTNHGAEAYAFEARGLPWEVETTSGYPEIPDAYNGIIIRNIDFHWCERSPGYFLERDASGELMAPGDLPLTRFEFNRESGILKTETEVSGVLKLTTNSGLYEII
jgi:hypothetical protein